MTKKDFIERELIYLNTNHNSSTLLNYSSVFKDVTYILINFTKIDNNWVCLDSN